MIDSLPNECLALIFSCLTTTKDQNNSSLVSHRWLRVEAETRTHLSLYAQSSLKPSIFTRFNSLTQLVLHSTDGTSIKDNDINLITSMSPNLTRLKLRECKELTDSGMAALLDNSSKFEVLSVESLGYYPDAEEMIRGAGGNGCLAEAFRENVSVNDVGVSSLPKSRDLIVLISVGAENCKGLKKLNVEYLNRSQIGDEGLIVVGKHSVNLEKQLLDEGRISTFTRSEVIATDCWRWISGETYRCETITEAAETCVAFRILHSEEKMVGVACHVRAMRMLFDYPNHNKH